MEALTRTLITLGTLFLLGLLTDALGRRTPLPRVTLLLLLGFLLGPSGSGLLPDLGRDWFPFVAHMALAMVGFLLGGRLTVTELRERGRAVLWISLAVTLATAAVVGVGLAALGVGLPVAILLASISTATAPAATTDVVHEAQARGPLARTLLGVVAVDDVWGILLFSVALTAAQALDGQTRWDVLAIGLRELGGAAVLGLLLGIPLALLTGRVRPGEPTLSEALGGVFLCAGLALWLEVSFLLASMVLGAAVANLARHHERPFHAIEDVEWPFLILFFVLSGAALEVDAMAAVGSVLVAYVALRTLGRVAGGWLGSGAAGLSARHGGWVGLALLPQAGVALGLALVASQRAPELAASVLPIVIAATVVFELCGPVATRAALARLEPPVSR